MAPAQAVLIVGSALPYTVGSRDGQQRSDGGRFRVVTDGLQARIGPSVVLPDRPGFTCLDEASYRDLLRNHPHQDGDPALWAQGFVRP